jgi:hypothetical protein
MWGSFLAVVTVSLFGKGCIGVPHWLSFRVLFFKYSSVSILCVVEKKKKRQGQTRAFELLFESTFLVYFLSHRQMFVAVPITLAGLCSHCSILWGIFYQVYQKKKH